MKNTYSLLFAASTLIGTCVTSQAATVTQSVTSANASSEWNDAIWDSPAVVPTSGNDYVSNASITPALTGSGALTRLGGSVTSRVRAYAIAGSGTFAGNSLEIVANTELLLKESGTYTANLTLNGGYIRLSPDSTSAATLAGTLNVASSSVLGVANAGSSITISSTVTGSGNLRLAVGLGAGTITFDDGAGTSLSTYTGILDIGSTDASQANGTIVFSQAYDLSLSGITMGDHSTADVLKLDADVTVGSFSFGGVALADGTYDIAALNAAYGTGSQFAGTGNLIVGVPEPSAALLGSLGALALLRRRRA